MGINMRGVKILIGLLVVGVLFAPSAYIGLHDTGSNVRIHLLTDHVTAKGGPSGGGNTSYTVSGTLTDKLSTFYASCGSALFPVGGYRPGVVTTKVINYPIREFEPDMDANQAEIIAVDTVLGNATYRDPNTPRTINEGPGFDSLVNQLVPQQQAIEDECNHHISELRWEAFFACPIGWAIILLGISWLLSLIFGGGGGGFDASITRDIFTGGWILRIWEK